MPFVKHILPVTLFLLFALPAFAQQEGITDPAQVVPVPARGKPTNGTTYIDPTFSTRIQRVSGASDTGGWGSHVYSQLQAFSPDNRYILLIENSTYLVRRLADQATMPANTASMNSIRWEPTEPHTLIFFDSNADDRVRVQTLNVETNVLNTVYTFPAQYTSVAVNTSYEEPSRDGRWMAALLTRTNGQRYIAAADLENGQLGAVLSIAALYDTVCTPHPTWGNVEPDWIGISPLGNYLMVQWGNGTNRCNGLEAFNVATGAFVGQTYDRREHGDLGSDNDGSEIFMTVALSSPQDPNRPAMVKYTLPGNSNPPQPAYLLVVDWATNHHISCQGPAGYCLVSYGGWDDGVWRPLENELFLIYTDGAVRRIAHHRSTQCGYWVQPRATISQDGSLVAFASDWGDGCQSSGGNGDTYVLSLTIWNDAADVNGDGIISPADTIYVINRIGNNSATEADVDGNGVVDDRDAQQIINLLGEREP
ncbi:MAG: dockerin type I domain-containing protein [Chloroflexota bacterium]